MSTEVLRSDTQNSSKFHNCINNNDIFLDETKTKHEI